MAILHLRGIITSDGKLEVDLPDGLTPGEVDVTIQAAQAPREEAFWTPEEVKAAMDLIENTKPQTGAEIIAMLESTDGWWNDVDVDGATWVEERRRKEAERRDVRW